MYPDSKLLSNSSATHGFLWEQFDFDMCKGKGLEEGGYFWGFSTTLCFALGFPASVAILWEMLKTHKRGTPMTPNDFFILNLTIMDAVFLVSIPLGVLNTFVLKKWEIEAVWTCIYALNQCGRPLLMACVCLDCYLAVVHPIVYYKRKSLMPRVVMAVIVWILTVAIAVLYLLFFKSYFSIISYVPYEIAMVIIGICDSFILYKLMKTHSGTADIHPQKKKSIQILVNSLVMTVISYLPPVILYLVGSSIITRFKVFICTIGIPISITSTLGSAIMPILYLINIGKLDCFRCGCSRKT